VSQSSQSDVGVAIGEDCLWSLLSRLNLGGESGLMLY
jgi:hypothetical protein